MDISNIFPLGIKDLNDCKKLDMIALHGLWTNKQWEKELLDPNRIVLGLKNSRGLIAIACGWMVTDQLQITLIAVHPMFQGRGYGKLILTALLNQAKFFGIQAATLEVKESNKRAQILYENIGFKLKGYRKNFYKDGSTALIFSLN